MPTRAKTPIRRCEMSRARGVARIAARSFCFVIAAALLALALALWTGSASESDGLFVMKIGLSGFALVAGGLFLRSAIPMGDLFTSQQNV